MGRNKDMEGLKKKYGEESREDKKNRHRKLFLPSVVSLSVCIAMVIVGYQYIDDCNVDAATFLLLGGGIVLATSALNVVAYLTPCEWDDRLADVVTPLSYFAHFVVMIWGSVAIFGVYSEVVYAKNDEYHENQVTDYYCHPIPFKFAFGSILGFVYHLSYVANVLFAAVQYFLHFCHPNQ